MSLSTTYLFNQHYPLIVLLAVFLAWPTASHSEVIFSDNFDASPDWQNQDGQRCVHKGHSSDGCNNLPLNYDFIYVVDKNPTNPQCKITSVAGRGSNGKGIRFYDESNGDARQWGSDCTIAKYLGTQHPELWVSYYVRYNPNMLWNDRWTMSLKTFRIGHYNPLVVDGTVGGAGTVFGTAFSSRRNRGLGSTTAGLLFLNLMHNTRRGVSFNQNIRCGGSYNCGGFIHRDTWSQNIVGKPGVLWADTFGNNQWQHIEIRVKMNSSIGANDGIVEVYLDDILQARRTDIPWRMAGTKSSVTGFNMVQMGGNTSNVWAGQSNDEQHMYDFDDLRVCTSRCPETGSRPLPPSNITVQ